MSGSETIRTHRSRACSRALSMLAGGVLASLGMVFVPGICPATETTLHLALSVDRLTFRLAGDGGAPWILQHSRDGRAWADLLYVEPANDGDEPVAAVEWSALPEPAAASSWFRAVLLEKEDPVIRDLLAARGSWRSSGFDRYRYGLRWNWSFFAWHGEITVVDGKVVHSETIAAFPGQIEPPELLTIDGWFDKVAHARHRGAEIIEVKWHPQFGFPSSGFIDVSTLIADEEESWAIDSFSPMR